VLVLGRWAEWPETKDETALAERDDKLGITTGKTPVSKSWFYDRHGIPLPAEGDELLYPPAAEPVVTNPEDGKPQAGIEAADASGVWQDFPLGSRHPWNPAP